MANYIYKIYSGTYPNIASFTPPDEFTLYGTNPAFTYIVPSSDAFYIQVNTTHEVSMSDSGNLRYFGITRMNCNEQNVYACEDQSTCYPSGTAQITSNTITITSYFD